MSGFSPLSPLYIHDELHPVADFSPACDYEPTESEIVLSVGQIHHAGMRSSVLVRP